MVSRNIQFLLIVNFFTTNKTIIIAGYPAVQRSYPQQPGMPSYQGIQKGQGYHGQRITPQPGSYQQPGMNPMMTSQYMSAGHVATGPGRTNQISRFLLQEFCAESYTVCQYEGICIGDLLDITTLQVFIYQFIFNGLV